jgi:hypothetical protein
MIKAMETTASVLKEEILPAISYHAGMVPVQKYVQIMENASVLNVHVKRLLEEILTKSIMEISVNVTILTA